MGDGMDFSRNRMVESGFILFLKTTLVSVPGRQVVTRAAPVVTGGWEKFIGRE